MENIVSSNSEGANIPVSALPNSHIQPISPQPAGSPELSPKKSRVWIVILIILLVGGLGYGGYYIYQNFFSKEGKKNRIISDYQKGPNFPAVQKKVANYFGYLSSLDILIFQKEPGGDIYGKNFSMNNKEFSILRVYGGELISYNVNEYGNYALIYYPESPRIQESDSVEDMKTKEQLKEAKGQFFLANLDTNEMISLGTDIYNFRWSSQNLYFIANDKEIWTYDLRIANYKGAEYQPLEPFYKVTDLNMDLIDYDVRFGTNQIYIIVQNPDLSTATLFIYDISKKIFSKIFDTVANLINFSPSGKYYSLFDIKNNKITIYESEKNEVVAEIINEILMPLKLVWDKDEQNVYFFSQGENISGLEESSREKKRPYDISNYYNLKKYNIGSKSQTQIVNGKSKNISNPMDIIINGDNSKLFFMTFQANNIYEVKLK